MKRSLMFVGLFVLVLFIFGVVFLINPLFFNESGQKSNIIPEGDIIIEKDSSTQSSYGLQCADKRYWIDSSEWIIEVVVESVEKISNSLDNLTEISTSRIEKYIKGTPFADKFILKHYSGYSTSGDIDVLLREGKMVRVYLIDGYKITGLEEHRGVFGFICQGVEEI